MAEVSAPPKRVGAGPILLCLVCAVILGLQIPTAKLAFEDGADPAVMAFVRSALTVLVFVPIVLLSGLSFRMPRSATLAFVLAVGGSTVVSYGYLQAVGLIPASLAAMMFYLFPLLVLFGDSLRTRRAPSWLSFVVAVIAFIGLALVFGPDFNELNPLGIAMAVMAAVGAAFYLTYIPVLSEQVDTRVAVVWMNVVIALCMIPGVLLSVTPEAPGLPESTMGWFWFMFAALTFTVGIAISFPAIRYAGAVTAAMLLNFEPVVIVALSAVLLGEVLGLPQYIGVAMVIGAMVVAGRIGKSQGA